MRAQVVLGLGYGDEGKGLTTAFLVSKAKNPAVIRFNGGHQAGHTVVKDGISHVSSSYGSGVLYGALTYIMNSCVIYPRAIINENHVLKSKMKVIPPLHVHPFTPVTTPFELMVNQKMEELRGTKRHGSVGVGFGETLQREENHYHLFAQDLLFPSILKLKLKNIQENCYPNFDFGREKMDEFLEECRKTAEIIKIDNGNNVFFDYEELIFEGAQGVLLDQKFGFFPNVTRSNTTSQNINQFLAALEVVPEMYYVTRSYVTRHGAGPMLNEDNDILLNNAEKETNKSDPFQGDLRYGQLDVEAINYALMCDMQYSSFPTIDRHLVVTCMDQFDLNLAPVLDEIEMNFTSILTSHGPEAKHVTDYKPLTISK